MQIELMDCDKSTNTYFFTIRGEEQPEIYQMRITPNMVNEVNSTRHYRMLKVTKGEILSTIVAFHRLGDFCQEVPTKDIFQLAKDPVWAPLVSAVYTYRKTPKGPEIRHKRIFEFLKPRENTLLA